MPIMQYWTEDEDGDGEPFIEVRTYYDEPDQGAEIIVPGEDREGMSGHLPPDTAREIAGVLIGPEWSVTPCDENERLRASLQLARSTLRMVDSYLALVDTGNATNAHKRLAHNETKKAIATFAALDAGVEEGA